MTPDDLVEVADIAGDAGAGIVWHIEATAAPKGQTMPNKARTRMLTKGISFFMVRTPFLENTNKLYAN